jgi:hypothetical protein
MESLEPTINLKTYPRKPKSSQLMENLDPLRTRFKNLDYIKIKTRWRTCLKNPDHKEECHKGYEIPLISSKFNQEQEEKTQLTMKIQYIVCLQMRLQRVFKPKPNLNPNQHKALSSKNTLTWTVPRYSNSATVTSWNPSS